MTMLRITPKTGYIPVTIIFGAEVELVHPASGTLHPAQTVRIRKGDTLAVKDQPGHPMADVVATHNLEVTVLHLEER